MPGLAAAGVLFVLMGVTSAVLLARELQKVAPAPLAAVPPPAVPPPAVTRVEPPPAPPTKPAAPTSPATAPARSAADPDPVVTPEPAATHPGLKRPDPLDEKYSLPRHPERAAALLAERKAWYASQLDADAAKAHRAYQSVVREAVAAQVEVLARPGHLNTDEKTRRKAALTRAVEAGCDDPSVMYAYSRYVTPGPGAGGPDKYAFQLTDGRYSAFRRLHANYNHAAITRQQMPSRPVDDAIKAFWAAVADLSRESCHTADDQVAEVRQLALTSKLFGPSVHARHQQIDAALEAAGAGEWVRAVVDARHQVLWAWEARGTGYADVVRDDRMAQFRERLEAAAVRLTKAHALAPDRPHAAAKMITVCMGLSRDRDEMEGWFSKALAADPHHHPAFLAKLEYLKPKWHGSVEELLAFGRQCLRASVPDDQLNGLLYLAYTELHQRDVEWSVKNEEVVQAIWLKPEVWADMRAAYEPRLAARPGDRHTRTRFFRICAECGQFAAAVAHSDLLCDDYSREVITDPAEWKGLNEMVRANLKQQKKKR